MTKRRGVTVTSRVGCRVDRAGVFLASNSCMKVDHRIVSWTVTPV